MRNRMDLTGQTFGTWTVIGRDENRAKGLYYFVCRCDCGQESSVLGYALMDGKSKGCRQCGHRKSALTRSEGSGVVFEARRHLGMTRKEFAAHSGLNHQHLGAMENSGEFYSDNKKGAGARLKFNRAVPEMRQPRPLFKLTGKTRPMNQRVRLVNCTYCRAIVEQLEHNAKRGARPFCGKSCSSLHRHHGPKPLDLNATQLTNVERYGPHVRDKSKAKLGVGLMKTVKQAAERKKEASQ